MFSALGVASKWGVGLVMDFLMGPALSCNSVFILSSFVSTTLSAVFIAGA